MSLEVTESQHHVDSSALPFVLPCMSVWKNSSYQGSLLSKGTLLVPDPENLLEALDLEL